EGTRQLCCYAHDIRRGRQLLVADDNVERVGRDEVHCQIGPDLDNTGGDRRGNSGVRQIGGNQSLQLHDEVVRAFGRNVDAEILDGYETIFFRLIRTKDGAKSTCADLVKHAKRSEGVGRRGTGSVRVQWVLLEGRRSDRNTETPPVQSFRRATVPFSWDRTRSNLPCSQTPQVSRRRESPSTFDASPGRGGWPQITPITFPRSRRFSAEIRAIAPRGRTRSAVLRRMRVIETRSPRFSPLSRSVAARRLERARRRSN